ncbi:MAG: serine--tRNA ligase [Methanocalculus sp. MSAO_Arc1]|uniref:serine--tRNA ligase n=1 Tax=Methanocalculus TaxID=71151 RepID=UPI000FF85ADA|nr:serine--tRNA ligase [Methanocalculus sp. MSAO_Arc1]MCP1662730.1 seryl-tRNA synthetase [Methanocalculus sp. AMF5]RQD80686.1 MAG: serine--tRNA ligase [Methanocalculus sp. MSAO_Arc1]
MLDIKFIRANPDIVRADLLKRNDNERLVWVDELLMADQRVRELKVEIDALRSRRNTISREINAARKAGDDTSALLEEAKALPEKIRSLDQIKDEAEEQVRYYLMRLPNILDESVPAGEGEAGNVEIRKVGTIRQFSFPLKNHGQLAVEQGWADFERAARASGSGFSYLKGNLVLLDMALQRYAIDLLMKQGFTPIIPPYMMNRESYEGVTDLSDFEDVMYKIQDMESYLIATSEHPICAMYQDEIFEEKDLPLKLAGLSPCFRKEIGSHGIDTKGLFRVHQFHKVEQFVFCKPQDSPAFHDELLLNAEQLYTDLGLPYHVVLICTGDIGTVAAKKYDIEVWMPREEAYREVVSCSNCTSYQAVRLGMRMRDPEDFETKHYIHTLNSTEVATSRTIRAILENYQQEDGSVEIPRVLRPYMNDMEYL